MSDSGEMRRSAWSDDGLVCLSFEGNPTILVVDDEELIREVASIMIEENGGKALTAVDGQDGVRVFEANKDVIDAVFMDFSMPNMNGYEAYQEIKKIKPSVKVIFVSGLKLTPEVEELVRKGETRFLSKPFHEIELIKAIREFNPPSQPQ